MSRPVSRSTNGADSGGRLGSVELLPPEADAALKVATEAVLAKRHTQKVILALLNASLAEIGIKPVSRSAFGRWVKRVAGAKRGSLTLVEQLPAAADAAVDAAAEAVLAKRRTQRAILAELNAALAAAGIEPVPSSTFNRWVVHVVRAGRHQRRTAAPAAPLTCPHCGADLSAHFRGRP
jgi:hypothetical protein